MITLASEYSAEIVEVTPLIARDVLKDLYQRLLPRSIRHRLGEYYTPDWLVQRVVNQVTGTDKGLSYNTRVLDPACGSGSFLVEVISRMVQGSGETDPDHVLAKILDNVVGFDLSPLAVQAARVNYLLALAPLLPYRREPISIPVYLADSVAPPRPGTLLEGDVRVFESSEGEWRLPAVLAEAKYLDALGGVFREALLHDHDHDWVMREVEARVPIARQTDPLVYELITDLHQKLDDLHAADRNGIWWQLIRNGFAPSLEPQFDYVMGNPPWVAWQTLPQPYRKRNEALWTAYSLKPDTPPGRRQTSPNVQLDVSMLFTAYCVDQYLKSDGKLGFVITNTVFKSELAGRGFRKRQLPNNGRYHFEHIDDLTDLQVFSNATNQTAVLTARRKGTQPDPLPVTKWIPKGQRTIPHNEDLSLVKGMVTLRVRHGEPADPADPVAPLQVMSKAGLRASLPARRASHYVNDIREGVNTRGANGVFFLDVVETLGDKIRVRNVPGDGKKPGIKTLEAIIEMDATRLLLRGKDVKRTGAHPGRALLFFHDNEHTSRSLSPAEANKRYPAAFAFAEQFKGTLMRRKKFRGFDPTRENWLGLYSVTRAALEPHKVVVREIARQMTAAAVHSVEIIPDHKLYVIPCKSAVEADRLASVLNSTVVDYLLRSFAISTSINSSFLRYIGIVDLGTLSPELTGDALTAASLGLTPNEYGTLARIARTDMRLAKP